jgi:glucose/mannose-6-phosphate isomerase
MKKLVENFSNQLREALDIAAKAQITRRNNISSVLITGLGGSGIGGTILNELVADKCRVPVIINKDYFLPAFVNESTMVIISSYSGNTEETVNAMKEAMKRNAIIIAVTSGGEVLKMAKEKGYEHILIPGGNPPRSCIGYCLVQLLKIFVVNGLADATLLDQVKSAADLLDREEKAVQEEAHRIAEELNGKFPVLYSLGSCEGVVVRFRQQINENSKMLCSHHSFPEMNHNELVGWTTRNEAVKVVTFHTSADYVRTKKRYEFCRPIFEKYSSGVIDIHAKGDNKLTEFLYLIHIGDWISCYIADIRGIDAVEVKVIDSLKKELSSFTVA